MRPKCILSEHHPVNRTTGHYWTLGPVISTLLPEMTTVLQTDLHHGTFTSA